MDKDEKKLVWKIDMFKLLKLLLAAYGTDARLVEEENIVADKR